MLLNEPLQNGNQVIVAGGNVALGVHVLTGGITVLANDNTAGKAVALGGSKDGGFVLAVGSADHVTVVVHVVLAHQEGDPALRNTDIAVSEVGSGGALHFVSHIIGRNQNVALFVHGFQHSFELSDGGHVLVVAGLGTFAVEGPGGIHDQGVEEHVSDSVHIGVGNKLAVKLLELRDLCSQEVVILILLKRLDQFNGTEIVKSCCHGIGLFGDILSHGLQLLGGEGSLGGLRGGTKLLLTILVGVYDAGDDSLDGKHNDQQHGSTDQTEPNGGPVFAEHPLPLGTALSSASASGDIIHMVFGHGNHPFIQSVITLLCNYYLLLYLSLTGNATEFFLRIGFSFTYGCFSV